MVESMVAKLKPDGAGFLWTDWKAIGAMEKGFRVTEWRVASALFHRRRGIGMGNPFRQSMDMIAYIRGPDHQPQGIGHSTPNFIDRHDFAPATETTHPAEKSVDLSRQLIEWSGGGRVLDPFLGSGTTLRAAKDIGRQAIGIEIEERYCEMAANRLAQEVMEL